MATGTDPFIVCAIFPCARSPMKQLVGDEIISDGYLFALLWACIAIVALSGFLLWRSSSLSFAQRVASSKKRTDPFVAIHSERSGVL